MVGQELYGISNGGICGLRAAVAGLVLEEWWTEIYVMLIQERP
jgi:hypothetical protein